MLCIPASASPRKVDGSGVYDCEKYTDGGVVRAS